MSVTALLLVTGLLAGPQAERPRRAAVGNTTRTGAIDLPAVTFHGTVKVIAGKEIVIVAEGQQEITLHRTRKTKFLKGGAAVKPGDIPVGAAVTIDVTKAPDLSLLAVNVFVDPAK